MSSTIPQQRATEKFKKSFAGSIKSLLNTGNRTYCVLEHKSNTEKHKTGEATEFIGDYIELGRGNTYAVNFGEDCQSVSRPHAAIIRKENGWMLKHLSRTNVTLLNNQRLFDEAPLNNGDEIQLSAGGPRLSFLLPANNKVSGMGMTIRMKAVMNEAIRPYKKTILTLAVVFILAISGLSYFIHQQNEKLKDTDKVIGQLTEINKKLADSTRMANENNAKLQVEMKALSKLARKAAQRSSASGGSYRSNPAGTPAPATPSTSSTSSASSSSLQSLYPDIYYVATSKVIIQVGDQTEEYEYGVSGTGFLLQNGDFVTARHVVEPWFFSGEKIPYALNIIANNGGSVTHYITAYSPNGTKLSFRNDELNMDRSDDKFVTDTIKDQPVVLRVPRFGAADWAVFKAGKSGGLNFNKQAAVSLPAATPLYVLGYPFGGGANSRHDIKPIYSECKVSRDGLDKGVIDISGRAFDHGNSGGPVFIKDEKDQFVVVGIVSASIGQQGFVVPISVIE